MAHRYAVMGNPIAHSLSPKIHQMFAQQTGRALVYEKQLVEINAFEQQVEFFFNQGGRGLNITAPFKERAFKMAERITSWAKSAQSANTLWMNKGQLWADNTDGRGLVKDLSRHFTMTGRSFLIIGAGGAVRGIIEPLWHVQPKSITITNRTFSKAERLKILFPDIHICPYTDLQADYDLIINATSLNHKDKIQVLPTTIFQSSPFCYDLSYQQNGSTPFVQLAQSHNCQAIDGMGMLVEQAALSFEIWEGVKPDTKPIVAAK